MKSIGFAILFASAATVAAQSPAVAQKPASPDESVARQIEIPTKSLEFKISSGPPALSISPLTTLPVQCTSDGALFLDMLDPKDPAKHTVVSIEGDRVQTYSPKSIPGLNDIYVMSFFPADSAVGFLVRGTTEAPGPPGPGTSPAGVAWSKYHYYIAEFNRDGSYKKTIRPAVTYPLSRFAILPSGEFLVTGYDRLNSAAHLLLLDQSGQVAHEFDLPAFRTAADGNAPYASVDSMRNSSRLMGSVLFTPYGQDILAWRAGGNDPVLEIGVGGTFREVSLQSPPGAELVSLIPATDRWVGLLRSGPAAEGAPYNQTDYAWYEFIPTDGGISAKLLQPEDGPFRSAACERNGTYITFERDKDGRAVLLSAK